MAPQLNYTDPGSWPASVVDAVSRVMAMMTAPEKERLSTTGEDELWRLRYSIGFRIRTELRLWEASDELLGGLSHTCGSYVADADAAALELLKLARRELLRSEDAPDQTST